MRNKRNLILREKRVKLLEEQLKAKDDIITALENENKNREKFFQEYPELKNKKIVLYAPTFRKNMKSRWDQILNAPISSNSVLMIKNHPGQHVQHKSAREHVYYMDNWKTIDLLAVCDCVITDYSAITLEAAVLKKPVYFWLYVYHDLGNLIYDIEYKKYDMDFLVSFQKKYLTEELGSSSEKITALIISKLREEESQYANEKNYNHGRRTWHTME